MVLQADQINHRIRATRTGEMLLTVRHASGLPLSQGQVTIRQLSHRFLFGCNAFRLGRCETPEQNEAYGQRFGDLLDYATLPFYWGRYELRQGHTEADRLGEMADWCREHGVLAKGHPLCWHEVPAEWLQHKSLAEVERLQLGRIAREVGGFAGRIDVWDVLNEACVMRAERWGENAVSRLCRKLEPVELIRRCFQAAREANPDALLILNDFDTTERYELLLAACVEAEVPFDVIGIQSHMHKGYWGAEKTWEVIERFARFGKPLHFTELTILSGPLKTDDDWTARRDDWASTPEGEQLQAEQASEFYRELFAHPAVQAVTWWDFSDQGAWQGAPAGLVRADLSPKPAYDALHKLIHEDWWTPEQTLQTDSAGRVRFHGFHGQYRIEAQDAAATFWLSGTGTSNDEVVLR